MAVTFIETREFLWKIHNFTKMFEIVDKTVFIKNFSIFLDNKETKWCFKIQFEDSQMGIYLRFEGAETDEFTVKYGVIVRPPISLINEEDMLVSVRTSNDYKMHKSFGWNKLPINKDSYKSFIKYLNNATLTLEIKVILSQKKDQDNPRNNSENQYQAMCKEYFTSKTFADITFICSDKVKIPAHCFVLGGFSPVFKAMLNIHTAVSKNNSIKVNDVDGETMTEILRFIYTQEVQNSEMLAVKLLYGAEKYELAELKTLCIAFMVENLSVDNALEYFLLGDQYNSKVLLAKSAIFIKSNYEALRKKNWSGFNNYLFLLLLDNYHRNSGSVAIFESTL